METQSTIIPEAVSTAAAGARRAELFSPYMQFAKLRIRARYTLASSGVRPLTMKRLLELAGGGPRLEELALNSAGDYGYVPLQAALARKAGVKEENIVASTGCSLANHLAFAALLEPGDEALIEAPAYELMESTARFLGARIRHFERRHEEGYRLDPDRIAQAMSPATRLIVITNLHNPSGALAEPEALREIGRRARRQGTYVLVDEVYLEMDFDRRQPSAFTLGDNFIVTSSLTKAYGLGGLRCGWIVAPAEMARRMWRLDDLFAATAVHVGEQLSVVALEHLEAIAADSRALLERNRRLLDRFLDAHPELETLRPPMGTIVFPRLRGAADAGPWLERLRSEYEVSLGPGAYFGAPAHFRLGIGGETTELEAGLERLGKALEKSSRHKAEG